MFSEDLSQFFNTSEFADGATLSGADVVGLYDKNYAVSDGGMGMATTRPAFTLAAADVPASPVGRVFVHDGVTYIVAGIDPDGSDRYVTVLLLERSV